MRALGERPGQLRSMRGWLGTVVRNLFREQRAAEWARQRREQECVRQRQHEPRDTGPLGIDELSVAQVAAELGVPSATVKTRPHRGLELLRADLAGRLGGERPMRALLSPLLAAPAVTVGKGALVPAVVGGILMQKVVAVLLIAALVLVWGQTAWRPHGEGGAPPATVADPADTVEPDAIPAGVESAPAVVAPPLFAGLLLRPVHPAPTAASAGKEPEARRQVWRRADTLGAGAQPSRHAAARRLALPHRRPGAVGADAVRGARCRCRHAGGWLVDAARRRRRVAAARRPSRTRRRCRRAAGRAGVRLAVGRQPGAPGARLHLYVQRVF